MDFLKAISVNLGVQFGSIPADGKMRKFKIGDKDEGFAILMTGCGAFGNWSSGEMFAWNGEACRSIKADSKYPCTAAELKVETDLVAVGNSVYDNGGSLEGNDWNRYILALGRVIEAKHG